MNTEKLLRPTWVEVSLSKLRRNAERVRELAGARKVMAVVKADAYGHGAIQVAKALAPMPPKPVASGSEPMGTSLAPNRTIRGVDWFGVATVEEALELRRGGIEQPILLLGGLYMSDPADLIEHRLTPSVSSTARLDTYADCARRLGKPIEFHLKVDTGMGRLGLPPDRLRAFVEHYRELEGLKLAGFLTHLATAEDRVGTQTAIQLQRFARSLKSLRAMGVEPAWIHVSNSAALVTGRKPASENLVRAGALFYGYCLPLVEPSESRQPGAEGSGAPADIWGGVFEPILSFKSRVVYLKDVPRDTPLGYAAAFHTRRRARIATVPVGYADGLSRALSNRGRALVGGRSAPIVGNVSMDLTLLDVTDIPGVAVGDEVVLIGTSGDETITALEIARENGTVPYEVLCSIGKRVPRLYVD